MWLVQYRTLALKLMVHYGHGEEMNMENMGNNNTTSVFITSSSTGTWIVHFNDGYKLWHLRTDGTLWTWGSGNHGQLDKISMSVLHNVHHQFKYGTTG